MRRLMLRPLLIVLLIPAPLVLWYAVPDHHVWHPRHSIGLALIVAGTALWFAVRLKVHGKLNATPQARFIVRNARPDRRLSQQCANRKEFCFAAEWISYPQQQELELAARVVRTRSSCSANSHAARRARDTEVAKTLRSCPCSRCLREPTHWRQV